MKSIALIFVLSLTLGSIGLQRASAQMGPPPAPMVPSAGVLAPATGANQVEKTKLLRIYNGGGFFDDALAAQLRPMLAKAFPSSMPEPPKSAPPGAPIAAPVKIDGPKKISAVSHL